MHVLAGAEPATRLVRIYHDDGSIVECEMTRGLAMSISRMDRAEKRAEREYRKNVKTATDLGTRAESWWQTKRFVQRHGPKPGVLYFGESSVWSGPASEWLDANGEPCTPPYDREGNPVRPNSAARCRWCGHLHTFPPNAVCYNEGCKRERKGKLG